MITVSLQPSRDRGVVETFPCSGSGSSRNDFFKSKKAPTPKEQQKVDKKHKKSKSKTSKEIGNIKDDMTADKGGKSFSGKDQPPGTALTPQDDKALKVSYD